MIKQSGIGIGNISFPMNSHSLCTFKCPECQITKNSTEDLEVIKKYEYNSTNFSNSTNFLMTGKVVIKLDNINYQYALILLNYCMNPQLSAIQIEA